MPSENNCIIEDVDNEVNFLNPYDFKDSDSFDSSDDDDGNCVDTCENNSFNSNDNDGLELFTFDDNSLINEHVDELHDMLCNVDDELNVDASLLDLNDVEFDTFHDNCLDDAIYIHDLLGEEKEETDGDLRDVLLSSEKEEEKESDWPSAAPKGRSFKECLSLVSSLVHSSPSCKLMGAAIHITGMQWNAIGRTAVTTRLFRTNSDAGNAVREEDLDRQLEPNPGRQHEVDGGSEGVKTMKIEEIGEKINLGQCFKRICGSDTCWCCGNNPRKCFANDRDCEEAVCP
nr:hypothetical protein Itr_chr05CG08690 [Ipomoea trifida]